MPNESRAKADAVNHPAHYTFGDIECIDAIQASLGDEGFVSFCRGTAMAYVWRAGRKEATSQDLAKAAWYMNRAEKVAAVLEAQGVLALPLTKTRPVPRPPTVDASHRNGDS